jgi:riboflavin kinase/FMN adenylyltransferase
MSSIQIPASHQSCCLTLGNFDGVHRGHQQILNALRELAAELDAPAVAATFDPHPLSLLRPDAAPPVLTSIQERTRLLAAAGVDGVCVLPVTPDLLQMSAREFFTEILLGRFHARGIVEGPNFHFGRNREGNTALLKTFCEQADVRFVEVPALDQGHGMISSSRIRDLLVAGQLRDANKLLGHPLRLHGEVVSGAQRGRTLGFPTANLSGHCGLIPACGVYAGICTVDGRTFPSAVNIGPNPTFGEQQFKIECHLAGFSGNLYGRHLATDLISEIRPIRTFASVEELRHQITADVNAVCEAVRSFRE